MVRIGVSLFVVLMFGCKHKTSNPRLGDEGKVVRHFDSFTMNGRNVFLKELTTNLRDSFRIICHDNHQIYLELASDIPSGYVQVKNIIGDSLPEIILDDCFACEYEGLRFFYFRLEQQRFIEIKGTDDLCSEFYRLDGTSLFYDSFYHGRSGCTSTLFQLREDTCIQLAKLEIPYFNEPITLIRKYGQPMREKLKARQDVDMDTAIRQIWMEELRKNYQRRNQ